MERHGRNLIGYRDRIKGPFRLAVPPDAIHFDVSPSEVRRLLDIPLAQGPGRPEDASALYGFAQAICQGNAFFDAGALDRAHAAYHEALAAATTPEQEVTALQKIGRTLERQARYQEARPLYLKALRLQDRHPELDHSTTARTHLFLGWLDYRQKRHDKARNHFYRALDLARGNRDDWLLGNVYNGLGLLQRQNEEYPEALALFRTALDYWCRTDYAYGIQAAYANIGFVYKWWGNHLRNHRFTDEARTQYRRAVEWLRRCLEFAAAARFAAHLPEVRNETGSATEGSQVNEHPLCGKDFVIAREKIPEAEARQIGTLVPWSNRFLPVLPADLVERGRGGFMRPRSCWQELLDVGVDSHRFCINLFHRRMEHAPEW